VRIYALRDAKPNQVSATDDLIAKVFHHHALILLRRELTDHRVSDRHEEQFTDALQHVVQEQPDERAPVNFQ
jgi:hypothetical protein